MQRSFAELIREEERDTSTLKGVKSSWTSGSANLTRLFADSSAQSCHDLHTRVKRKFEGPQWWKICTVRRHPRQEFLEKYKGAGKTELVSGK